MAARTSSGEFAWPTPRPKTSWTGARDRALWFKHMFIDHGEVRRIVADAWAALRRTAQSGTSFGMLILAGSGAGKTQLAEAFKENVDRVYGRDDPERIIVPAVLLAVPDRCTPRALCIAILKALGDPDPERRPRFDLIGQTVHMLNACEVRCVITDNVQDIPTRRGIRGVEQVSNCLRELIDQTACVWLLLGTDSAREVVDNASQLIKRVPYRVKLHYFDIHTERAKAIFLKLLVRIDAWLPLAQRNDQLLLSLAGQLFIATEGILDRLRKLLDLACDHALQEGRESLVRDDFLAAFASLYGPQVDNPFAPGFVMRQLRQIDEPFQNLHGSKPLEGTRKRKPPAAGDEPEPVPSP